MKSLATLSLLALCSLAPAQAILIVDVQNRPGTQFTSLQPAVDAAQAGDIVVMRDGAYSTGATITRGIQVLGMPGVVLTNFLSIATITVDSVPAGERVVLKDLTIGNSCCSSVNARVLVSDCAGPVLLDGVRVQGAESWPGVAGITIERSGQVVLNGCSTSRSRGGLRIVDSTAAVIDCSVQGHRSLLPTTIGTPTPASAGCTVIDSTVVLSRCALLSGGDAAPGLLLSNATATLTDASAATGMVQAGSSSGTPAIAGTGSLTLDADVLLAPAAGGNPIDPTVITTVESVPSLTVTGAPIGSSITGALASTPGELYAVILGDSQPPLATPYGLQWVLPIVAFLGGALDPTGVAPWTIPIPADPVFLGVVLTYQGVAATADGIRWSNPSQHTITQTGL